VKAHSCFETKKAAKPVHAVTGILGKKEMLPLMDKGVAGAILELRPALTCLWTTATISTATTSIGILSAKTSTVIPTAIFTAKKSKLGPEINTIITMISIPTIVLVAGVLMVVADALQRKERRALANSTSTVKSIAKDTICFETKKGAEKVLAATGMIMKKERLPSMDKDVVGAILAPILALICM